jgi:hypothetical protein
VNGFINIETFELFDVIRRKRKEKFRNENVNDGKKIEKLNMNINHNSVDCGLLEKKDKVNNKHDSINLYLEGIHKLNDDSSYFFYKHFHSLTSNVKFESLSSLNSNKEKKEEDSSSLTLSATFTAGYFNNNNNNSKGEEISSKEIDSYNNNNESKNQLIDDDDDLPPLLKRKNKTKEFQTAKLKGKNNDKEEVQSRSSLSFKNSGAFESDKNGVSKELFSEETEDKDEISEVKNGEEVESDDELPLLKNRGKKYENIIEEILREKNEKENNKNLRDENYELKRKKFSIDNNGSDESIDDSTSSIKEELPLLKCRGKKYDHLIEKFLEDGNEIIM